VRDIQTESETGVTQPEEQEKESKTLWDMFMEYMNNKDKAQDKRFVEAI
jgi:hypothetical protein